MDKNIYIVIMAGGSGTRFWPYSRDVKPKQFLDVLGTGQTLLQITLKRFEKYITKDNVYIVSNEKYETLIQQQLPLIKKEQILSEPQKRNTAPCIAYAANKIYKKDPNAIMVVTPADHVVFGDYDFEKALETAIHATDEDRLITIGIRPSSPETAYGYIQYIDNNEHHSFKKVKVFVEKPNLKLAHTFLKSGEFLWNSGIFVWSVSSIIHAFNKYQKGIADLFSSGEKDYFTPKEKPFIKKIYSVCKNISIDYAILEHAKNVYVVPASFGWSDLGSWDSLHKINEKDENNNVLQGNIITYESKNNLIKGDKNKIILVKGLDNYLIADFKDVLLVCKKEDTSFFRQIVTDLKSSKKDKFL